jgi:hypothetical protein
MVSEPSARQSSYSSRHHHLERLEVAPGQTGTRLLCEVRECGYGSDHTAVKFLARSFAVNIRRLDNLHYIVDQMSTFAVRGRRAAFGSVTSILNLRIKNCALNSPAADPAGYQ